MHFDLHAPDADVVDAEAERLVGAGASLISSNEEHGVYWKTLRDPEGNEFCVGTPLPGHSPRRRVAAEADVDQRPPPIGACGSVG